MHGGGRGGRDGEQSGPPPAAAAAAAGSATPPCSFPPCNPLATTLACGALLLLLGHQRPAQLRGQAGQPVHGVPLLLLPPCTPSTLLLVPEEAATLPPVPAVQGWGGLGPLLLALRYKPALIGAADRSDPSSCTGGGDGEKNCIRQLSFEENFASWPRFAWAASFPSIGRPSGSSSRQCAVNSTQATQ